MKRISMAVAALALMSGAAFAQQAPGQPAQPADSEEAARKGTINQPTGAGQGAGGAGAIQPADPEQAARKGGINQPSGAGGSSQK